MSPKAICVLLWLCLLVWPAQAQLTYSGTTTADAFLATGSPDNPVGADLTGDNFGAAGTLAISPPSADKGAFESVIRFNFSDAVTLFNSAYGTNAWNVAAISLTLTSNYGTNGVQPNNKIFNVVSNGNFVIEWITNDILVEGTGTPALPTSDGITWDSLPELLSGPCKILCTNTYSPPGINVPVIYPLPLDTNLVAAIVGGGDASLFFYAADSQIGYLFNSHEYGRGNDPLVSITAMPLLKILSGYFTNGVFRLTGVCSPNVQCEVQANSDLTKTNWQILGTITTTNGIIQFDDLTATNQQRFYRLSESF